MTAIFIILFVMTFLLIDSRSHSASDTLIALFLPNGLALLLGFLCIVYSTGEKPEWRRGCIVVQTMVSGEQKTAVKTTEVLKFIEFADFQKIDLRVAKIVKAERVPNSEKLIRLELALGNEQRQIVAGIGKNYEPDNLMNREIIIVANLVQRKLMGLESNGMLLAAQSEQGPVLLMPEKSVVSGAKVS